MTDTPHRQRITESLAGPTRLEAMTLRCGRDVRHRIEAAFGLERAARPQLSLGRFLAECVANGLPENLPPAASNGADPDGMATRIAERVGEQLNERLADVETAIPVIADVLGDLTQRVVTLDQLIRDTGRDTTRVRELIESAVSGGPEDGGDVAGEDAAGDTPC